MSEIKRYRKVATIVAEQLPEGETRQIQTWEGPATVTGPDYQVWANDDDRETWAIPKDFFDGVEGYEPTGETGFNGHPVYRKKETADVYAYRVDTDDHEPVYMPSLNGPFRPTRDYYVVCGLNGENRRAVEASKFSGFVEVDGE